ncbi:BatD family protein, partial [Candidatus Zixiibacteriota bacterium]
VTGIDTVQDLFDKLPPPPKPTEELQSDNLFLRAEFDRKKAYPGQQITVTYVLYNRTSLGNVQYGQLPTFSGFWTEEIYNADRLNFQDQVVGGKRYQVAVLKKLALFPTTSGQVKVDPMELVCDLRVRGRDIFDFFGRSKRVRVTNQPVTITVQPLPAEGKPSGFTGTVGQYTIKASVDSHRIRAGEPLELTVRISGQGNLKTVPAPQLPSLEDFKIFEPEAREKTSSGKDKISGSKTYKYVLIPKEEGQYDIEAMELVYFDPSSSSYRTARTETIAIEVLPGEQQEYPLTMGLGREEIKLLGRDIRYIKPAAGALRNQGDDLYGRRAFQILQIVPLLIIAAVAMVRRHRDRISGDIRYARWRRAPGRARRGLKETHNVMRPESSPQFYALLSKTLSEYLGDKLNLAAGGLTCQQLREELTERRVDRELIKEILDCIDACDHSRFAPTGAQRTDMSSLRERVRDLIDRLERSDL